MTELNEFGQAIDQIAPNGFTSYENHFSSVEDELSEMDLAGTLPSSIDEIAKDYPVKVVATQDGYDIEPIIPSILVRHIANEHGVVQIGQNVYQYSDDKVVVVPYDEVVDFTDLRQSNKFKEEIYIETENGLETSKRRLEGLATDNYTRSGDDHRLKARWYSRDKVKIGSIYFSEVFIEAKHQRKGSFGIWYGNREDEIRFSGSMRCYIDEDTPNRFYFVNRRKTNTKSFTFWVQEEPRSYPLDDNKPDDGDWVRTGSSVRHTTRDDGPIRGDATITK